MNRARGEERARFRDGGSVITQSGVPDVSASCAPGKSEGSSPASASVAARGVWGSLMRIFLWSWWRDLFLKSDDALARPAPHFTISSTLPPAMLASLLPPNVFAAEAASARPDDDLGLERAAPFATEAQTPRKVSFARPLAGQLAVQQRLNRVAKAARSKTAPAKTHTAPRARKTGASINRPSRPAEAPRRKRTSQRRQAWVPAR